MNQANRPSYQSYPDPQYYQQSYPGGQGGYPAYQPPQAWQPPQQPQQVWEPPQSQQAWQPQPQAWQPQAAWQPQQAEWQPAPAFAIKQKDPRKSGALRTLNTVGMLLVIQTVMSFMMSLLVVMAGTAAGVDVYDDDLALLLLSIGMTPICTAGPPLVYMLIGHRDWNFHLRFGKSGFFGCLLVVLAGLGVCMAANIPAALLSDLLESLGSQEAESVLGQGGGWANFIVELLGVAVMVPMLEEFAFRGVILSSLRRYGTGFAIAASSVIFGMAHMSASSVVFATIAGAAMGTAYVLTGNLWVSVCIHALNNGIAVVESYSGLFLGGGVESQELLSAATMLGVFFLAIMAAVLLLILRKRLLPRREPVVPADGTMYEPLTFGEAALTMVKSPVLWAIFAMVLVELAMTFVQ